VTLHIPQLIKDGHHDIADLAAKAGCGATTLRYVMDHVTSKGVFRQDGAGRFEFNAAAEALVQQSRHLDLDGIGGRFAQVWGTLLSFVRTGRPAYSEAFGRPFWADLAAHPELARSFDALLAQPLEHGISDSDFEISGGWESIRTVVDVGGGAGTFLAELLRQHTGARGVLIDLPASVARAAAALDAAGVGSRATTVAQSFFDPLPAGADLYLLRRVLTDWPDEETVRILQRCAEAARPSGRVVVIGGVSPDDAPRSLDVEMLMVGGGKNTISEFRLLARAAGLDVTSAQRQPPAKFVIECQPLPG